MQMHKMYVIGCVFLFAFLSLWGLHLSELWNDEAITAYLGKNCLEYGYPRAHDTNNWTDPRIIERVHLGPWESWVTQPWLQYYVAASSQFLLGKSSFAARLPFALLGFLSIFPLYATIRRLFADKRVALLACLLASTSVPYVLHIRQCRYYALVIFFTILMFYAFVLVVQGKRKALWLFFISSVGLFHSNHAAFLPLCAVYGMMWAICHRKEVPLRSVLITGGGIILAAIPWYIITRHSNENLLALSEYTRNVGFYLRVINKYLFSIPIIGGLTVVGIYLKKVKKWHVFADGRYGITLVGSIVLISILFFGIAEQRTIRYVIHLVPFLACIQAYVLMQFYDRFKKVIIVFVILFIGTNLWSRPQHPQFYLAQFLYEITHDYDGPVEAIVNYFRENGEEGDMVKIIYGDAQMMFYLPHIKLINDYFYKDTSLPDYIVDRKFWREVEEKKMKKTGREAEIEAYWSAIQAAYDGIELPAVDIPWENRPDDMEYHKFKTVTEGRNVMIYKKKSNTGNA